MHWGQLWIFWKYSIVLYSPTLVLIMPTTTLQSSKCTEDNCEYSVNVPLHFKVHYLSWRVLKLRSNHWLTGSTIHVWSTCICITKFGKDPRLWSKRCHSLYTNYKTYLKCKCNFICVLYQILNQVLIWSNTFHMNNNWGLFLHRSVL